MAEQNIINMYINQLATTNHAHIVEKDKVAELEAQVAQLTAEKAAAQGDVATLSSELQSLQEKYNTLKEQVGSAVDGSTPATPAPASAPETPHF